METIRLLPARHNIAARAAAVLQKGGVVLYPTDTLYGLGADAFSDDAVAKVYDIKGREEGKPIHALVSGVEMAEEYGEVSDLARQLLRELPRGMLTLIVPKKRGVETGVGRGITTFGFRGPDNAFCQSLLKEFGSPVTATSANRSGEAPRRRVVGIIHQLGESADNIDMCVDAGELPARMPSTVVDLSRKEPIILREGAILSADVWQALRAEE